MKASELRLNNWVRFSEEQIDFKVIEISEKGIAVVNVSEETWIELDQFEPIPLTEEWLVKFGFKLYPSGYFCLDLGSSNTYFSIGLKHHKTLNLITEQYESTHLIEFKHIKYVHQLQNLYFALTGEELTLNSNP